jgi:HipA-like protein
MNALQVTTPTGLAGTLAREADHYQFAYAASADARSAVSLTMPLRRLAFTRATLPPIFLSDNTRLFVMRRFDRTATGRLRAGGAEDVANLSQ